MEPHRLPQSVFAWGPAAVAAATETRVRSISTPSSASPSGGPPRLSSNVPVLSHLPRPDSYPRAGTPSHRHDVVHQQRQQRSSPSTSSSYPVFPAHHEQSRSNNHSASASPRPPLREAVLYTKNPLAASTVQPINAIKPKMHLYAADKKPKTPAPTREEDFPEVPVEWLVGSPTITQTPSDGSSVSLSELHSGDVSEDEFSEASSADHKSAPLTPALGDVVDGSPCHYLSVGLKALLKVEA